MRLLMIIIGFLPYALLASYDCWLHKQSRRVPRSEQIVHFGLATLITVFLFFVINMQTIEALFTLGLFSLLLILDEFAFHTNLPLHERRLHWTSDVAMFSFVLYWFWFDEVLDSW